MAEGLANQIIRLENVKTPRNGQVCIKRMKGLAQIRPIHSPKVA